METSQGDFDRQYFSVLFRSGELVGLWPSPNRPLAKKLKAFSFWVLVGLFLCSCLLSAAVELARGNFVLFASAAGPGFVTINLFLKLGIILRNWQGYTEILRDLRQLVSYPAIESLFKSEAPRVAKANRVLLWMCISTGVFYALAPWFMLALQHHNGKPLQLSLQTTSWWYWDISGLRGYIPAYLLNVVIYFGVPHAVVLVDGLILDVSLYGGLLFEEVSRSLSSMSQVLESRSFSGAEVSEFLDVVARRHQKIIEFCRKWRTLVVEVVLVQFLYGVFEVCFGGFTLIATEDLNTRITYVAFTSAVITQAFFYCWGGQALRESSLDVSMTLYSFPWYEVSSTESRKLALMLMRAQKPVVLDVPFFEISYPTFIKLLKASHTYITLLSTLM